MSAVRGWASVWMALCVSHQALGDGGVPIASTRWHDATLTLLVSPAAPTVGEIEFTLLGPGAVDARLELRQRDGLAPQVLGLVPHASGVGAFARATLDAPGPCEFVVHMPGQSTPVLSGSLPVRPAAPPWQRRLPWMLAWMPVAALLALRALAVRARSVSYTRARSDG